MIEKEQGIPPFDPRHGVARLGRIGPAEHPPVKDSVRIRPGDMRPFGHPDRGEIYCGIQSRQRRVPIAFGGEWHKELIGVDMQQPVDLGPVIAVLDHLPLPPADLCLARTENVLPVVAVNAVNMNPGGQGGKLVLQLRCGHIQIDVDARGGAQTQVMRNPGQDQRVRLADHGNDAPPAHVKSVMFALPEILTP